MKIILFQPEIPQNTGNIIRTCSVTDTQLILVTPCGFSLNERHLKRASLDYLPDVNLQKIDDLDNYLDNITTSFYFFSSKADKFYTDVQYNKNSCLIFGSETSGLPEKFHEKYEKHFVKIPMKKNSRCLNLSNCVSVALYEALRQNNFLF